MELTSLFASFEPSTSLTGGFFVCTLYVQTMTRDSYYAQALQGRSRNPRSYRKDDSYHNAVGSVTGFFAGLFAVTMAVTGFGAMALGGSMGVATALNYNKCQVENFRPDHEWCNPTPWLVFTAVSIFVGLGMLSAAAAILRDYNN